MKKKDQGQPAVKASDPAQNPEQPQFQMGATSEEAYDHVQLLRMPLKAPGAITARLQSQQWSLPRNAPSHEQQDSEPATTGNQGTPYG